MASEFELLLLSRLGRIERQLDILINTPIRARSVRKVRGRYDKEGRFQECGEPSDKRAAHPACMGRAVNGDCGCTCEWFLIPKGIDKLVEKTDG